LGNIKLKLAIGTLFLYEATQLLISSGESNSPIKSNFWGSKIHKSSNWG